MIKISKTNNKLTLSGHSQTDICAAISSITYTGANFLDRYKKDCIDFKDDVENDYLEITINEHDEMIDKIFDTMIDMYRDVLNQVPTGSISLEVEGNENTSTQL